MHNANVMATNDLSSLVDERVALETRLQKKQLVHGVPTNFAKLDALTLRPCRSLTAACRRRADVVLRDPPLRPGAGHRREIDPELGRHLADERRRANLLAL